MNCPHCHSSSITERQGRTVHDFQRFRCRGSVTQVELEQVTTDGHTGYPRAIADELGTDVDHRTSQYKNNVIEQDH